MRKTDQLTYYTRVRRMGQVVQEESKGYCFFWTSDEGIHYPFIIRKDDRQGKGWQIDDYHLGLKIGGSYATMSSAAASLIYMIMYKDLLATLDYNYKMAMLRDGRYLNDGDPVLNFRECCYDLKERIKDGKD